MIINQKNPFRTNFLIITIVMMVIVFISDSMLPLGVAGGVPYIVAILISLWYEKKRFTITIAVVSTFLTILGFFSSPAGGELWKVFMNRVLALFAIWTVTILSLQRKKILEEKEEAVMQREEAVADLKILKGYIPICASCKKIRDDDGLWSQMELYISKHSEADFTHGICPDCVKELYPGYEK